MKFEVVTNTKQTNRPYHARIVGANGDIVFSSQRYTRKESAKHACEIVRDYAKGSPITEVTES